MPSVSQVSTIETPGADSGTPACSTTASGPGSPSVADVEITPATGAWEQNCLRPSSRYPPGTSTAVVDGQTQSEPPLVASTRPVVGDLAQHALGVRGAAAPPPALHEREVQVHGRGERRRAGVAAELLLGEHHLPHRGAEAAQLGRAPAGAGSRRRASRRRPRSRSVASRSCPASNSAATRPTRAARATTSSSVIRVVGTGAEVWWLSCGEGSGRADPPDSSVSAPVSGSIIEACRATASTARSPGRSRCWATGGRCWSSATCWSGPGGSTSSPAACPACPAGCCPSGWTSSNATVSSARRRRLPADAGVRGAAPADLRPGRVGRAVGVRGAAAGRAGPDGAHVVDPRRASTRSG